MTSIASSSQRSNPSELPKLPPHHYGIFQRTLQKPHLRRLGSLFFCVGLTLSEPAWSAPQVGSAARSVSPPDPKESVVVTTTSTQAIPSDSEALSPGARQVKQQPLDQNDKRIGKGDNEIAENREQNCSEYSKLEPFSVDNESRRVLNKSTPHSSSPLKWTEALVELEVHPLPFTIGYSDLREPTQGTRTFSAKVEERILAICQGSNALVGNRTGEKSDTPATPVFLGQPASNSVAPFQVGLEFSSERMSEKLLLTHLPTDDPPKSPLKRGTLSGSVPPVISKAQPPLTPPLLRGAKGDQTLSTISQTSSERNSELPQLLHSELVQSQSFPSENNSESEQTANQEDPELGILRLRELPTPPPPAKPSVYLLGGAGYFRSNNIFSAVEPLDDGLFRAGVTLLAVPSLGPQTSLFASVGGNIIRYSDLSDYNYDELRFSAGIRQQIGSRTYGELGWLNRHLFSEEGGDRFLNDHSVYLELGRRDPLTRQLALDTYYQLRLSFANPSDRSQLINSLGASLAYYPFPALEAALDYQFALADFTQQEREDQYHQLLARLTYTLSRNSRFYLFGGRSFGDSSDEYTDFDGWVFGAGVDLNLVLF